MCLTLCKQDIHNQSGMCLTLCKHDIHNLFGPMDSFSPKDNNISFFIIHLFCSLGSDYKQKNQEVFCKAVDYIWWIEHWFLELFCQFMELNVMYSRRWTIYHREQWIWSVRNTITWKSAFTFTRFIFGYTHNYSCCLWPRSYSCCNR